MTDTSHDTDFKTLRSAYNEVKSFIESGVGATVISLNTKIEEDLGCAGDDNLELLEKFVAKYNLGISGFDYSRHFLSESELFDSGAALLTILTIPISLLFWIIKLLTLGKLNFTNRQLIPDLKRKTSDITFGDMLTWYITGTYNLRQNVHMKIKNAA